MLAFLPNARAALSHIRRAPATFFVGGAILFLYFGVAVSAQFWAPFSYSQIGTGLPLSGPSLKHFFGVDQLGRDVFSRVVLGTDKVLFLAFTSTFVAMVMGGGMGLLSGFIGGWFDTVFSRVIDLGISIPILVFALLVVAAAGTDLSGSLFFLVFVVALVYFPRIARMARAVAIDWAVPDVMGRAHARGEAVWYMVWRELLPNAAGVLLVEFGVRAGWAPVLVGTLGFLGFGVRPPLPEWGLMISENRIAMVSSPSVVLAPMIALTGLVIGLNFFTDGLARLLGRASSRGAL